MHAADREMPAGGRQPSRDYRHVCQRSRRRRPHPDPMHRSVSSWSDFPDCEFRRSPNVSGFAPGLPYAATAMPDDPPTLELPPPLVAITDLRDLGERLTRPY